MNVSVVRIGNSRGIRIPKKVLDDCQIGQAVDLTVKKRKIILTPVCRGPREGWSEAAKEVHHAGDVVLLLPDVLDDDTIDLPW